METLHYAVRRQHDKTVLQQVELFRVPKTNRIRTRSTSGRIQEFASSCFIKQKNFIRFTHPVTHKIYLLIDITNSKNK